MKTFPRILARLDARALSANYQSIREQAQGQSILAMVKAGAYGHGAEWVARELMHERDLCGFGVATLEEGAQLRESLGARGKRIRIVVFSGAAGWTEDKGRFCERHGLTPVIATDADWSSFWRGGWAERIPYELKFNTGMNRLGLSLGLARPISKLFRENPSTSHPAGIMSHLAQSETPGSKLSRQQLERFVDLRRELSGAAPGAQFHLANSGAIWNLKDWGLKGLTDIVRPGISLYGITPWPKAPRRGLVPVMTLSATVLAVHRLKAGTSVGYGATFVAEEDGVTVAVLAAGYGDGVHRALSNRGHASFGGRLGKLAGIVSMDLCTAICPQGTKVGSWAELLGVELDIWEQAQAAGTIPYELLTSVTGRVQRIYE